MSHSVANSKSQSGIRNSTLILWGFATAFFPRLLDSFGVPSVINFVHFGAVPVVVAITALTTRVRDRKQVAIVGELAFAIGAFLVCGITSALVNEAGVVNVFLDFMLKAEPFLFLLALMSIPVGSTVLKKLRKWFLGFALCNLGLAIIQSVLLPIGVYPKPDGGTIADNIGGVFGGGGGSAANYVSCTVSIYFTLYFFNVFKTVPLWIRIVGLLSAFYQVQVSDSKQVFLALIGGGLLLVLTKTKRPGRLLMYIVAAALLLTILFWALRNLDAFAVYRNWTDRGGLYGPDGEATRTKLAAFRIIPSYYESPLNWLFGLGPGHSVSRLGGWILRDYGSLLLPLGATIHPSSTDVFNVVSEGWIAKESTIFFPLFTWAGIWGDLGLVGLGAYFYLGFVVWRRLCVNDFCKFLLLSTIVFGFILTQVEEPGHVMTIACLLGLCWHEEREKQLSRMGVYLPPEYYPNASNALEN